MSTEKNFVVTNSSSINFVGERFTIKTAISKELELPFCKESYRVTMFDGIRVQLKTKDNNQIIEGILA